MKDLNLYPIAGVWVTEPVSAPTLQRLLVMQRKVLPAPHTSQTISLHTRAGP